jgi:tetratricopeptide (TPR) repeat protein/O-antigen ligase
MESRILGLLRIALIVYTVLVVLLIVPLTTDPTGDSKRALLHLAAALFGLVLAVGRLRGWIRFPPLRVFLAPLLLLLAAYCVAALVSNFPLHTLPRLTRLFALAILYLTAAVCIQNLHHVRQWMIAACAAVALSSAYAFAQWLGMDPLPWDVAERSSVTYKQLPGTFGNPNYAGHAMVLCTVLAAYLITIPRMRWAALFILLYAAQMAFALQRGAVVALAGAGAFVLLAWAIRRLVPQPAKAVLATFAVVLLAGSTVLAIVLLRAVSRDAVPPVLDTSTILRYNAYAGAATMIGDRPLVGFGPGNFVIENTPYWTDHEQRWFAAHKLMNQHVHCDLLEVGVEAGIPGALGFLAFLLAGAAYGLRFAFRNAGDPPARRFGYAAAAFFIAFLVDGIFGFDFYVPVSASFLFLFAGAFEGVTAEIPAPARERRVTRYGTAIAGLTAAAVVGAIGVTSYMGHYWLHQGRRAIAGRQFALAEAYLARGETVQPWNWLIPYHRGAAAQVAGDPAAARGHFARALDANPYYIPAITYLARLKLAHARQLLSSSKTQAAAVLAESEALAKRALELAPARAEDADVLGRVYFLRAAANVPPDAVTGPEELWRTSRTYLARALEGNPTPDVQALLMLGQSAAAIGDTEAADHAFARAVAALPPKSDAYAAYFRFGTEHAQWQRYAAVLASQLAGAGGTSGAPAPSEAWAWLEKVVREGLHYPEGLRRFTAELIASQPDNPHLWNIYARLADSPARRQAFVALVQQLMDTHPTNLPFVARVLGMAWSGERGALAGATKLLNDALDAATEPMANVVMAAELLEAAVRDAGDHTPGVAVAVINVAALYVKLGEPERAVTVFAEKYERLKLPEQMLAAPHYTEALIAANRGADAEALVQRLITIEPNQAELRLLLARVFARNGKHREAREVYSMLLAIPDLDPATKQILVQEQGALRR